MILSKTDGSLNLLREELEKYKDTFEELGVRYIGIAGSFVRDEMHSFSDIDIFVSFSTYQNLSPEKKWNHLSGVNSIIYDLIGQDNLDLSIVETLPLKVKFHMLNEGVFLYGDEDKFYSDKGDSITRFLDFKPFLDTYYRNQRELRQEDE